MGLDRRRFLGAAGLLTNTPFPSAWARGTDADDGPTQHDLFMRLAIEEAQRNVRYPFGAVIVASGRVLGRGVNASAENPSYHGEMAAMADYVRRVGNRGWADAALYTTAEPCPCA